MVRRLVEEQQVGPLQEQAAEGDTAALAAGKGAHVGVGRRAAQRVHGDLHLVVQLPGIHRLDAILHPTLLLQELLHLIGFQGRGETRADFLEAVEQGARFRYRLLDVAAHALRRIELRLLRQEAHLGGLGRGGFAGELVVQAGHDAEQRALAGPVRADDADLGAPEEGEPDPLQDLDLRGDHLAEVLHGEDVFAGHPASLVKGNGPGT